MANRACKNGSDHSSKLKHPVEYDRVFFYPHAYLRDRQLDTVRNWPPDAVVNPAVTDSRTGTQVERNASLAIKRWSWKQILPLINIKRRPDTVPAGVAVYLWSGIMATGPYISDIDNPYAFTAYNVSATRLYKSLIRLLLSQNRCLQIRCMSQACQQGLANEFGDTIAAKSVLSYPAISAKVTNPPLPKSDECRFLFIATQFEIKGGPALLRAFRNVHKTFPGARLDIVTHLPEHYRDTVGSIPGLYVHDATFTRGEIAKQFLSHADVLIHPTYMDSFGMIILEAMSFGLPVIASNMYAIPEMVEEGKNGRLISPPVSMWNGLKPNGKLFFDTDVIRDTARRTDTEQFEKHLTGAMLEFANNPEQRRMAGSHSLKLINERFQQRL